MEVEGVISKRHVWERGAVEKSEHSELEQFVFLSKSEQAGDRRRASKSLGKNGPCPDP